MRAVNGDKRSTPEEALALYAKLRRAIELRITIDRKGEPVTLVWSVR